MIAHLTDEEHAELAQLDALLSEDLAPTDPRVDDLRERAVRLLWKGWELQSRARFGEGCEGEFREQTAALWSACRRHCGDDPGLASIECARRCLAVLRRARP